MASAVRSTSAHSAEFADRLSADARPWRAGKSAWALLAGLFAICLIPRLLMAWKLDAACDDAYYYVFVANCLKKGDFVSAFDYLNLNVYPAILLGLHQLGFDWIVGGKIWGAVVGSLTVLPMFGWVRRLFDDRVAGMAGFLYAVHPHLIEVSVEPIREATFWFFLTLSLYFIWRSIDGLRIHDFVIAGAAVALALHTRIEGWALFVPLAIWAGRRWWILEDNRRRLRLAFGTTALVAVTPLLIIAVNTTVLRDHVQWEYGRLNHFSLVGSWMRMIGLPKSDPQLTDQPLRLNKQLATSQNPASAPAAQSAPAPAAQPTATAAAPANPAPVPAVAPPPTPQAQGFTERFAVASPIQWPWLYLKDLTRSVGPISLIFLIVGMINWRGLVRHHDKAALIVVSLGMLVAIWIRLVQIGNLNGRYFLVLPFFLAPWHALGCLDLLHGLRRLFEADAPGELLRRRAVVGVLALMLVGGWADALKAHHKERQAHVLFGQYLQQHAASADSVVADLGSTRAGYFVNGTLPTIIAPVELLDDVFDHHPPDVIVFSRDCLSIDRQSIVIERATSLGLEVVNLNALPRTETEFIVMMRMPTVPRDVEFPPQTAVRETEQPR